MDLTTLDLDTPATYAGIFDEILYADDVWPGLNNYFNDRQGKINELFADPASINDSFLKKLQYNCENLFRKKYDHVTAYHACRTNDPEQYRRLGLLIASQERLEAKAREVFRDCFAGVRRQEVFRGACQGHRGGIKQDAAKIPFIPFSDGNSRHTAGGRSQKRRI